MTRDVRTPRRRELRTQRARACSWTRPDGWRRVDVYPFLATSRGRSLRSSRSATRASDPASDAAGHGTRGHPGAAKWPSRPPLVSPPPNLTQDKLPKSAQLSADERVAATLIALVPRLRRLASRRVRPHLLNIWANVKTIATEPRKIVYVLVGSTLAQLLVILALGTSLHAVGQHASIATLITVNTFAGLIGGAVPVLGGLGVVEAGQVRLGPGNLVAEHHHLVTQRHDLRVLGRLASAQQDQPAEYPDHIKYSRRTDANRNLASPHPTERAKSQLRDPASSSEAVQANLRC